MTRRARGPLTLFVAALLLTATAWVVGFATGLYVSPPGPLVSDDVQTPANIGLYHEAWQIVDREFYGEKPPGREITYAAVDGVVEALDDPFSTFVSRDDAAGALDQFEPEVVGGMGVWIEPVADGALVISVVPGTPGARFGLEPGDVILAAGQDSLGRLDRESVLEVLRGPAGSSIVLIVRRGRSPAFAVEVERDDFNLPAVEVRRPRNDVAYLRISHFAPDVLGELDQALATLTEQAVVALILDLRDNPGGRLDSARAAAGRFVDGEMYVEVDRDGDQTVYRTDPEGAPAFDLPERLVVLVDGGTASAAEMLAGALRDSAGAELVGSPTFGKGSIQTVMELSDRSVMRLTIAEWRTPSGMVVDGAGLSPNISVEVTEADREAGRDPQLDAALRAATRTAATAGG